MFTVGRRLHPLRPLAYMADHSEARVTRSRARMLRESEVETLAAVKERLAKVLHGPEHAKQVSQKLAAVLVPLFASEESSSLGEVRVLLTQRSSSVRTHQGEVCLPGGKREPEDADDVTTALREANEELGLVANNVEILGCFQSFLSKHALSVTPVVAVVPSTRELHAPTPDANEVAEVFDVPLSVFLSRKGHSSQDIKWQDHTYRIHYFDYQGHTIWGLTAGILIKIARVALGREPEFQETAPKGVDYGRFWHDGNKVCVHTAAGDGEGLLDSP